MLSFTQSVLKLVVCARRAVRRGQVRVVPVSAWDGRGARALSHSLPPPPSPPFVPLPLPSLFSEYAFKHFSPRGVRLDGPGRHIIYICIY
jgi:hypothetical protein